MIRYIAVLRRRPGSTTEEFLAAWLGEHRALASALPHVRSVLFQPTANVPGIDQAYDGVGFLDFDSVEDLRRSLASEEALALRAHTATFAEPGSAVRVVVDPGLGSAPERPRRPTESS
ncbi:MAG: EthD family reductase [Frankiales bacterium]|nr:EthD family reductase [Frankiales bacterium]